MCKGKNAPAVAPGGPANTVDARVAVFTDAATDGDLPTIERIYEECERRDKKGLLTYDGGKSGTGRTALHLAANNGHADIVEYLVRKIVEDEPDIVQSLLNGRDGIGFTPLCCACFRGYPTKGEADLCMEQRLAIVRCLLENGADCSPITRDTTMTPAHWAAYNRDADVCRLLLKAGADPFVKSTMDRLPIDVAGSCLAGEVIDVFLDEFRSREEVKKQSKLAPKKQRTSKFSSAKSGMEESDFGDGAGPFSINAD